MDGVAYPLLLKYREVVFGNGFMARVAIAGRALMVEGEEGVWIYGVNPGGICNGGDSQKEAASAFREAYRSVLFDLAAEARGFAEFGDAVRRLVDDTNHPNLNDWLEAVKRVRAGEINLDWLEKQSADSKVCSEVQELRKPKPSLNVLSVDLMEAA